MGRTVSGCLRMEHLLTALFLFCVTSLLTPLVVESVAIAVLFLIASLVIGIVCYGTLLVQVGILRLATTSSTCHLTRPMLKSGTRQILRLLLAIFLLALALILIASFLVVLLRMPIMLIIMAGRGVSDVQFFDVIFDIPTGIPTVNAILSALGALLLVPSVILLLRLRRPSTREAWLRRLFASSDRRGQGREGVAVEYRLAYTDTIRACADGAPTLPADYAELTRRLAECVSDRERLRLAYRMMVACLVSRRMGVALSDTPREIAAALVSRGIGSDAEGMSRAFETAVYAPPGTDGEDASLQPLLERILQITRVYLP